MTIKRDPQKAIENYSKNKAVDEDLILYQFIQLEVKNKKITTKHFNSSKDLLIMVGIIMVMKVMNQEEKFPKTTRVFTFPPCPSQANVPDKNDGGMSSHHIKGAPFKFFGKLEIGFAHFEEDLNIPTFSVELDDFLL